MHIISIGGGFLGVDYPTWGLAQMRAVLQELGNYSASSAAAAGPSDFDAVQT